MMGDRRSNILRNLTEFFRALIRRRAVQPTGEIDWDTFEQRIGYSIHNTQIFTQALKHRSYLSVRNESRTDSYERLEFLGDAVLNLAVSEFLFNRFPRDEEGDLTKNKALLVNKRVLGRRAEQIGLGEFVLMSEGEEKSGGRNRVSILADILESVLGAILMDGGYEPARRFVVRYVLADVDKILFDEHNHNYKGELLEYTQSHDWGMPSYSLINQTGPEHQKSFMVEVLIKGEVFGTGQGTTKKNAEQQAAKQALTRVKDSGLSVNT